MRRRDFRVERGKPPPGGETIAASIDRPREHAGARERSSAALTIGGTTSRMRRPLLRKGFSLPGAAVARLLLLVPRHVLPKRFRAFP
jgi:hypothetical protein